MNRNIILSIAIIILGVIACEKPEVGYLSDHIFYNVNPFEAPVGVTTFSSPIVANGSTSPLQAELVSVRDADGNDVTESFTTPGNIVTFTGTITYQDSTVEMLAAKVQDSLVMPFAVNPIGGRLEFSAATGYLATGTYYIDVKVGNQKGEYIIENACEIQLTEVEEAYRMNYKRVTLIDDGVNYTDDAHITVDVEYIGGGDSTVCIYRFLDRNGDAFNPAEGEVGRRSSSYPFFDNWAPWYPLIRTDTAFVHQMPHYQGIEFPYFNDLVIEGDLWSDVSARYDFKIPEEYIEELDQDLGGLISFQYLATGTFIITTQMHTYTRASN
ncbi:hypothetical protein LVD15_23135 [Fulvivirga maritima]|uniref:hypothetical protein n=1 Tax=Fulvivirga maritima TaxID=2904247 RepID=UPI001F2CBB6B|nr:hypothetical protein [Fulvivirga maritima]UII26164.1 hypothetical protein LVD15_23135 [Fulvivirga maritima]